VAELATQVFITSDRPNVVGLILAGSAEFKNTLNGSQLFDPRLQGIVQKLVDVSYGPLHSPTRTACSACDVGPLPVAHPPPPALPLPSRPSDAFNKL